jgi:EAL domain-containing protein (putative c-di-GMP-specific phosphodiesterase class I)
LERDEFYVVYQPIIENEMEVDREALLRWNRPIRENHSPADFIPVLEVTNRIVEVGTWVLEQALQRWPNSPVSVNVSTIQLEYDFYSVVKRLLGARDPSTLTLEITESSLLLDTTKQELERLKSLGVKIALDDFGTGYSSLSALLATNIDEIKIDGSFIQRLPDVRVEAIIEMIIKGRTKLGYMVVAEGVETDTQAEILEKLGLTHHQGYRYSRPVK